MKSHSKIIYGCSQGRLIKPYNGELQCFPKNKWIEEFKLAQKCGLNFIELFIDEEHNTDNPIWSKNSLSKINIFLNKYSLNPYSACISYIINNSIFDKKFIDKNVEYVINVISKLNLINIKLIILPLLNKSDLCLFDLITVKKILKILVNECRSFNMKLAIESTAYSAELINLLTSINDPNIGYVYDTGNRFEVEDPFLEITALKEYIFHVHLKDIKDKQNVIIGNGNINFKKIISILKSIKYNGKYNFETNRGIDPFNTMKNNIRIIDEIIQN